MRRHAADSGPIRTRKCPADFFVAGILIRVYVGARVFLTNCDRGREPDGAAQATGRTVVLGQRQPSDTIWAGGGVDAAVEQQERRYHTG